MTDQPTRRLPLSDAAQLRAAEGVAGRIRELQAKMWQWLREAERLERKWDEDKDAAFNSPQPHQRPIDALDAWYKSPMAADILGQGIWAHRKTRSYAAVIAAERHWLDVVLAIQEMRDRAVDTPRVDG